MTHLNSTEPCMICGRHKVSGSWFGELACIGVCGTCATEELPALIADAIYGIDIQSGRRAIAKVNAKFWEAFAGRIEHEAKGQDPSSLRGDDQPGHPHR